MKISRQPVREYSHPTLPHHNYRGLPRISAAQDEENVMHNSHEASENDVIDYGSVADETKGGGMRLSDFNGLPQPQSGLSDD